MTGKTSVLRQRRRDAFSLTLLESKPFICNGSWKSTALAHNQPCVFPAPFSPNTHAQVCNSFVCGSAQSFYSWRFTSQRYGVEGHVCHTRRFPQKSHLCKLPLEMCWISAFLRQVALFLHVAVIRATDKTCENELIFLLNSSNYTKSK